MTKTALLVMDVQNGIVERFGDANSLKPVQVALKAARDHGLRVIFVRVAFRPGYPDVNPRNLSFSAIRDRGGMDEQSPSTQIWDGVKPIDNEPVVVKRRVSAFAGSGLELLLRSLDVDHLVLTGIATSGVVLSTLRQAADLDYRLTVLKDACLDGDPEVHRVLTEKIFPRQATVTTVAEWMGSLARIE
jgi:nicotinamidase-related amidase